MKKSVVLFCVLAACCLGNANAWGQYYQGTASFRVLDPVGGVIQSEERAVSWDGNLGWNAMTFEFQPCPFGTTPCYQIGAGTLYGEGVHAITTPQGSSVELSVGSGQLGGFFPYDNYGIPGPASGYSPNVWDVMMADFSGDLYLTAADADGDGIPGIAMVDGAFPTFTMTMDIALSPVPVPAALMLIGCGLPGLLFVKRRLTMFT